MSHIREIDGPTISDLGLLEAAAQRLGGALLTELTFRSYQDGRACDYLLRFPGCAYDVGVRAQYDKATCRTTFGLVWDPHSGGGLRMKLGAEAGLLRQAYATEAAVRAARRQGYSVQEQHMADGRIVLRCNVGG